EPHRAVGQRRDNDEVDHDANHEVMKPIGTDLNCNLSPVIAGLDPAIHLLRKKSLRRMMDPRVKPAGDDWVANSVCPLSLWEREQSERGASVCIAITCQARRGRRRRGAGSRRAQRPPPARA